MEALAKQAMVEAAVQAAVRPGGTTNQSRIAAITGMPRPEVARVLAGARRGVPALDSVESRAATLVRAWTSEPAFRTKAGKPRVLTLQGTKGNFAQLARKYGGDVPPAALLTRLVALQLARIHRSRSTRSTSIRLLRGKPLVRDASQAVRALAALADLATATCGNASPPVLSEVTIWSRDAIELAATRNTVSQRTETFLQGLRQALSATPTRTAPRLRVAVWTAIGKQAIAPSRSIRAFDTKSPKSRRLQRVPKGD